MKHKNALQKHKSNPTKNTDMKKTIAIISIALTALTLSSCGTTRAGALYTDVTAPVAAGSGTGSRVGVSKSTTYFGLVSLGDASIAAAKRNGGITTVNTADEHISSILGIITTFTTTVRGN